MRNLFFESIRDQFSIFRPHLVELWTELDANLKTSSIQPKRSGSKLRVPFGFSLKRKRKKMNTCCIIRREWERGRGSGGENGSGSGSGRSEHREYKKIRRNYDKEHPTGGALISSGIERNILNQSKAYSVVEKYWEHVPDVRHKKMFLIFQRLTRGMFQGSGWYYIV